MWVIWRLLFSARLISENLPWHCFHFLLWCRAQTQKTNQLVIHFPLMFFYYLFLKKKVFILKGENLPVSLKDVLLLLWAFKCNIVVYLLIPITAIRSGFNWHVKEFFLPWLDNKQIKYCLPNRIPLFRIKPVIHSYLPLQPAVLTTAFFIFLFLLYFLLKKYVKARVSRDMSVSPSIISNI